MNNFVKDKKVVITGVSKGIGLAMTQACLGAGMTVYGWGRTRPETEQENFHFHACDITDQGSVEAAASETLAQAGQLHFLINNAGFGHFSQIQDFPPETFKKMWEVNVWGAFQVTQSLVPNFQAHKSGHILNISSIAGRVGAPWGAGYNASKFALSGMGESLFHELRKQGIKVTNIYPGSIATHFFDEIPGVTANEHMLQPGEFAETILHVMNTSPNFLIRELEVRPLNSKPVK